MVSFVSKDPGPSHCPTPHSPPCLHPALPLPQVTLVLGEILMHKRMAALYYLEPDEHFFKSFFQAVEPMDEEER